MAKALNHEHFINADVPTWLHVSAQRFIQSLHHHAHSSPTECAFGVGSSAFAFILCSLRFLVSVFAPFFGAFQSACVTQPVEESCLGRNIGQLHALSVQKKGDIHGFLPAALPCPLPLVFPIGQSACPRCGVENTRSPCCKSHAMGRMGALARKNAHFAGRY